MAKYKPQTWMQEKILSEKGYTPYCGNGEKCDMPRTRFDFQRLQFVCPHCGWVSNFPLECMKEYAELNK